MLSFFLASFNETLTSTQKELQEAKRELHILNGMLDDAADYSTTLEKLSKNRLISMREKDVELEAMKCAVRLLERQISELKAAQGTEPQNNRM